MSQMTSISGQQSLSLHVHVWSLCLPCVKSIIVSPAAALPALALTGRVGPSAEMWELIKWTGIPRLFRCVEKRKRVLAPLMLIVIDFSPLFLSEQVVCLLIKVRMINDFLAMPRESASTAAPNDGPEFGLT